MRQVALFAAFILSVGWVAPPPGVRAESEPIAGLAALRCLHTRVRRGIQAERK